MPIRRSRRPSGKRCCRRRVEACTERKRVTVATTVTMPQLGQTVTEGTILRWAKKVGDSIAVDEVLVEISTDKVDTEVPSPAAGVVSELLVGEGETVAVGTALAVIGDGGAAGEAPADARRQTPD